VAQSDRSHFGGRTSLSGRNGHGWSGGRPDPDANDPKRTSADTQTDMEHDMKAFVAACLAAVALAAIGLVVLNHVQEPADKAFATPDARVGYG
jgi:hypothetical protein